MGLEFTAYTHTAIMTQTRYPLRHAAHTRYQYATITYTPERLSSCFLDNFDILEHAEDNRAYYHWY